MIEFEDTFGAAREEDLRAFEDRLGMRLPDDYRRFLLEGNGGIPEENILTAGDREVGVRYFLSVGNSDPEYNIESNVLGPYPEGYLGFGTDDGGNGFLLKLDGADRGSVWFWDHELEHPDTLEDPLVPLRADFATFMADLQPFTL